MSNFNYLSLDFFIIIQMNFVELTVNSRLDNCAADFCDGEIKAELLCDTA